MAAYSDVFLVSSPLQAIVTSALLTGGGTRSCEDIIVFVEDASFVAFFDDVKCVPIHDTRSEGRSRIAENLKIIDRHLSGEVNLWVSDILWPMNNAVYTLLRRKEQLKQVHFFDEGIVLYWQERLTLLNRVREWAKFKVLRWKLGVAFTTPAREPFYGNAGNGLVYALHSELLSGKERVRALELNLDRVAQLSERMGAAARFAGEVVADGAALVLSQPYYRITQEANFEAVMAGLARHLRESGHERIYIKLHPSEGTDLFNRYYRDLGFEMVFSGMKGPVEIVLGALPASCTLVSFNSSALLNARRFGFRGRSLSYGLNWVAAQYPLHRTMFRTNVSLFRRADVEVVLH